MRFFYQKGWISTVSGQCTVEPDQDGREHNHSYVQVHFEMLLSEAAKRETLEKGWRVAAVHVCRVGVKAAFQRDTKKELKCKKSNLGSADHCRHFTRRVAGRVHARVSSRDYRLSAVDRRIKSLQAMGRGSAVNQPDRKRQCRSKLGLGGLEQHSEPLESGFGAH
ncbi:hypothetical protein BCV70DRAFT_205694 [Testicularia cyperi]|uniref:Uncharacterized protein n=1 Tax=Testicularia cyperi TaxID=1882483 RepID=A0A317XT70_9BASI|nr:hypothetical protein BCV70DRAFT_205694 [Testicularia cyperi]